MKNRYYGVLSFSIPQKNIVNERVIIKTKRSKGKRYFFNKVADAYGELIDCFSADENIIKLVGHSSGFITYEGDFSGQIIMALVLAVNEDTNQDVLMA